MRRCRGHGQGCLVFGPEKLLRYRDQKWGGSALAGSLRGLARTTSRVRAELQASNKPSSALARRYGLNRITVAKWRARTTTQDAPMGLSTPHSTVPMPTEDAIMIEFRRQPLLSLDDLLGCLCDSIPELTRSSLHRCLERYGISRLPGGEYQPQSVASLQVSP